MPTALFLSPHLDDVAFSCGGTVARFAAAGWQCIIATAFTQSTANPSGFARDCQTDKGIAADVDYMALRRAEDAVAVAALGAEARWLDFPEAPHRGYGSAVELFAGVKPEDDIYKSLAGRLGELCQSVHPAQVFVPQGLGNHADHLQLIRAVRLSVSEAGIAWYRDTPYAIRHPALEPPAATVGLPGFMIRIGGHLTDKLKACAAYQTQLDFQFGGEALMREALTAFALDEGQGRPAEKFLGQIPADCGVGITAETP